MADWDNPQTQKFRIDGEYHYILGNKKHGTVDLYRIDQDSLAATREISKNHDIESAARSLLAEFDTTAAYFIDLAMMDVFRTAREHGHQISAAIQEAREALRKSSQSP